MKLKTREWTYHNMFGPNHYWTREEMPTRTGHYTWYMVEGDWDNTRAYNFMKAMGECTGICGFKKFRSKKSGKIGTTWSCFTYGY